MIKKADEIERLAPRREKPDEKIEVRRGSTRYDLKTQTHSPLTL